ncbi:MAG: PLP-dependent aminotransferase family protein [Nostoc sp.]|uniref:MocR-like pyridoxine biosynthesis transcription factor PdxR n=1 Tax=Nostoc sp. TaxID=1180 RepID=UPI002FF861A2
MPRKSHDSFILDFTIDRGSEEDLANQIYSNIRSKIILRDYPCGFKLPGIRAIAAQLKVSKSTVSRAIKKLKNEGYLEGGERCDFVVTDIANKITVEKPPPEQIPQPNPASRRQKSMMSKEFVYFRNSRLQNQNSPGYFHSCKPDFSNFPKDIWCNLQKEDFNTNNINSILGESDPQGHLPLRQAIVKYLKNEVCFENVEESQIIIVSGTQEAINLACRVLVDPGDAVCIEDPGYIYARDAFLSMGANLIPVPVDDEGINVKSMSQEITARMAYVTPSHQFPLGVTMSKDRRTELLTWAEKHDTWILEDIYDHTLVTTNEIKQSLKEIDTNNRVIYIDSFNKTLFSGLRLGYMVVPHDLVDSFVGACIVSRLYLPLINQRVLTEFMETGNFVKYINKMREIYEQRRTMFKKEIQKLKSELIEIPDEINRAHIVLKLPDGTDDVLISKELSEKGLSIAALSKYYDKKTEKTPRGLVIGCISVKKEEIEEKVNILKQILQNNGLIPILGEAT